MGGRGGRYLAGLVQVFRERSPPDTRQEIFRIRTYEKGIVDVQGDKVIIQGQHLQVDLINTEVERNSTVMLETILL